MVFVGALATGTASADAKKDKDIEERFKAADKDGDGKLTLAEAKAGMPKVAKGFDKIDKEKKGYVTVEQIKAFAASQ
jgi:Ca2+-binding EF-hand superfamily protein